MWLFRRRGIRGDPRQADRPLEGNSSLISAGNVTSYPTPQDNIAVGVSCDADDDNGVNDSASEDGIEYIWQAASVLVDGFSVRNLRICNLPDLEVLPSRLHVQAKLELIRLPALWGIPEDLSIMSLSVINCASFTAMPDMVFYHDLHLQGLPALQTLPSAVEVEGNVVLINLPALQELPAYLHVQGNLCIYNCHELCTLPDGVCVDGDIVIENCPRVTTLAISMLESRGAVHLRGTGITDDEITRLQGLAHPALQFLLSGDTLDLFETLEEAVNFWISLVQEAGLDTDPNIVENLESCVDEAYCDSLLQFLHKLRTCKEYRLEDLRSTLAFQVVEAIELIISDEIARPQILLQISNSVDSCGDQVAWALNQLSLGSLIAHARGDREALRELGLRVMRLEIVHDHARKTVARIHGDSFSEEVEVYLGFEIALRDRLNLPVTVSAMLYPRYVQQLAEVNFEDASEAAMNITSEDFETWLLHWDEWLRQDRLETCQSLQWEALPLSRLSADDDFPTDLYGDPAVHPVRLGSLQTPCELDDLVAHWVSTSRDFNNSFYSVEDFLRNLQRVST